MSQSKNTNRRRSGKDKSLSHWKPRAGQPPYEEIIQKALHDMKHYMGFTREAVLNHISTHYGIPDKKKPMLQINAALRNGVKHGTLEQLSGRGVLGVFRLVEKTTKASPEFSKCKRLNQSGKRAKPVEILKAKEKTTASVPIVRKTCKTRERHQEAPKKATKISKTKIPGTACQDEKKQIASTSDGKETLDEIADATGAGPSHPSHNKSATLTVPIVKNVPTASLQTLSFLPKRGLTIENEPDVAFHVCGMVPLSDGRIVIADLKSLKVYLPDMTTSPDLTLSADQLRLNLDNQDRITDIAMFNETVAVVSLGFGGSKIHFIDISSVPVSVCHSFSTRYLTHGITACPNFIYVTSICEPPSVKKIDGTGKVYWSVSGQKQMKPFFKLPYDIHSFSTGESIRLVVVENSRPKQVTLLDGESGNIMAVRCGLDTMRGLTTDHFNNIYICYWGLGVVSVMPPDLSDERVILTSEERAKKFRKALVHDLDEYPENIAFDQRSNSLFITSGSCGKLRGQIQVYQFC